MLYYGSSQWEVINGKKVLHLPLSTRMVTLAMPSLNIVCIPASNLGITFSLLIPKEHLP